MPSIYLSFPVPILFFPDQWCIYLQYWLSFLFNVMWPKCHKVLVKGGFTWGTTSVCGERRAWDRYLGLVEQEDISNPPVQFISNLFFLPGCWPLSWMDSQLIESQMKMVKRFILISETNILLLKTQDSVTISFSYSMKFHSCHYKKESNIYHYANSVW